MNIYEILSLRFKLFCIIGIISIWGDGISQSEQGNKILPSEYFIGAEIGLNDFHVKDEYLSPLPYRGILFAGTLSFEVRLSNTKHEVELFYTRGNPSPDNQTLSINQNAGSISYSFLMDIEKFNLAGSPINIFLGLGLSSFVMNSDLRTNSKQGLGYYPDQAWYWSHSVNLNAEGEYHLSESKNLSIQFQIPFYKIVTRPANGHWLGTKNQKVLNNFLNAAGGGKGEFFWKNFVILYKIEYRQIINEHFAIKGNYLFNYTSSNTPLSMGMYMNNFSIGIDWLL